MQRPGLIHCVRLNQVHIRWRSILESTERIFIYFDHYAVCIVFGFNYAQLGVMLPNVKHAKITQVTPFIAKHEKQLETVSKALG